MISYNLEVLEASSRPGPGGSPGKVSPKGHRPAWRAARLQEQGLSGLQRVCHLAAAQLAQSASHSSLYNQQKEQHSETCWVSFMKSL